MKRTAFLMRLRPGAEARYLELHCAIWPELAQTIRACGIRNHSVFRAGLSLVAYLEADDVDASLRRLKSYPVKHRWDALMNELLDPEAPPVVMEEVFYLG